MPAEAPVATLPLSGFGYSDFDSPLTTRPLGVDGRWNRAHGRPTQYFSSSIAGVWRALGRIEGRLDPGLRSQQRRCVWECRIESKNLLDLCDARTQKRFGLTPSQLLDADFRPCQDLADGLDPEVYDGLIAPDPTSPSSDEFTIALFGPYVSGPWDLREIAATHVLPVRLLVGHASPPLSDA